MKTTYSIFHLLILRPDDFIYKLYLKFGSSMLTSSVLNRKQKTIFLITIVRDIYLLGVHVYSSQVVSHLQNALYLFISIMPRYHIYLYLFTV